MVRSFSKAHVPYIKKKNKIFDYPKCQIVAIFPCLFGLNFSLCLCMNLLSFLGTRVSLVIFTICHLSESDFFLP